MMPHTDTPRGCRAGRAPSPARARDRHVACEHACGHCHREKERATRTLVFAYLSAHTDMAGCRWSASGETSTRSRQHRGAALSTTCSCVVTRALVLRVLCVCWSWGMREIARARGANSVVEKRQPTLGSDTGAAELLSSR